MHSSGNLHHSKDVSTMWTDASNYGQIRRKIRLRRMCDVHVFLFCFLHSLSVARLGKNLHAKIWQNSYHIVKYSKPFQKYVDQQV